MVLYGVLSATQGVCMHIKRQRLMVVFGMFGLLGGVGGVLLSGCGLDGGQYTVDETLLDQDQDASNERPIIGGEEFDGLPAVGALLYQGNMHCTGTIIGPRKVLTA